MAAADSPPVNDFTSPLTENLLNVLSLASSCVCLFQVTCFIRCVSIFQLQAQSKPTKKMPKQDDGRFMAFVREQSRKESDLYEMLQEYMVENEALR